MSIVDAGTDPILCLFKPTTKYSDRVKVLCTVPPGTVYGY